jgi:hypothetical protein
VLKQVGRNGFDATGNLACAVKAILIGGKPPEMATVS